MDQTKIRTHLAESTPCSHNTLEEKGSRMGRRRTSRDDEYRLRDVIMQLKFLIQINIFKHYEILKEKLLLCLLREEII